MASDSKTKYAPGQFYAPGSTVESPGPTEYASTPEQVQYLLSRGWIRADEILEAQRKVEQARREVEEAIRARVARATAEAERQRREEAAVEAAQARQQAATEAARIARRKAHEERVSFIVRVANSLKRPLEERNREINECLYGSQLPRGASSEREIEIARGAMRTEQPQIMEQIRGIDEQLAADMAALEAQYAGVANA